MPREILVAEVQAEVAARVRIGRGAGGTRVSVAAADGHAGADNAPRALIGAERADVVKIIARLSACAQGERIGEGVTVEDRRRDRTVVGAFDAVVAPQEADVVAVFVQSFR